MNNRVENSKKQNNTKCKLVFDMYKMLKYYAMLIIAFSSFNVIAQKNCVDFESYELSQSWVRELNILDADSRKDYILNRIKCERFFRKENIDYYDLLFLINGLPITFVPEYRDVLLSHIKAENLKLLKSPCEIGIHRNNGKCMLGIIIINELDKPIVDNIDALKILKVDRKTKVHRKKRIIIESKIRIKFKCIKSQEFIFRIEDFSNKDNYKTEKIFVKSGRRTIDFSIDNEVKIITLIDSENNLITLIN